MRQFIITFILIEGLSSVATGLFIVVAPKLFAQVLLGDELTGAGLYFAQLYGAMIAAWGAVSVAYLRAGSNHYRPFAGATMVGTIPTNLVLILMLLQGVVTVLVVAYLLMTLTGMVCRLFVLYRPVGAPRP